MTFQRSSTLETGRGLLPLRSVIAALAGLVLAALAVLLPVSVASAHGGPFQLHVASDAAGGVIVSALYAEDGHVVSEIMDPVVTAVSSSGEEVGPIALMSASEGIGLWESPEPFMSEGEWTVTVTTTVPSSATVTVPISVMPIAEPVDPTAEAVVPESPEETVSTAPSSDSVLPTVLWVVAGVVIVAVLVGVVISFRRRRAPHTEA